jgi:hypothetical protein
MPSLHIDEAVELIQMEYAEMPGLKLTFWQAQRLWNLTDELCLCALTALTRSGFLARTVEGSYVRRDSTLFGMRRGLRPEPHGTASPYAPLEHEVRSDRRGQV